MSRDRWIGLTALLFMFSLGLVCGLWIGRGEAGGSDHRRDALEAEVASTGTEGVDQRGMMPYGVEAEAHHEAALRDLQQAVGLDDMQMQQVHEIFSRNQDVVREAWRAVQPKIEIAMEKVHREVAELMGPEQRRRYHAWLMARRGEAATTHGGAQVGAQDADRRQIEPRSLNP